MSKSAFRIAHGASIVVVRDGKRKVITAGAGDDFTQEELDAVNRIQPGALRSPVNEGTGASGKKTDEDGDKKPAKTAAKTKAPASGKKADDADEDEDI